MAERNNFRSFLTVVNVKYAGKHTLSRPINLQAPSLVYSANRPLYLPVMADKQWPSIWGSWPVERWLISPTNWARLSCHWRPTGFDHLTFDVWRRRPVHRYAYSQLWWRPFCMPIVCSMHRAYNNVCSVIFTCFIILCWHTFIQTAIYVLRYRDNKIISISSTVEFYKVSLHIYNSSKSVSRLRKCHRVSRGLIEAAICNMFA